ncbi:MAG: AAA family ATPase, partial [Deltaproteobacteria bacterium]|nr:AAA family ATPase [Deltaproteobacteria bacterium]
MVYPKQVLVVRGARQVGKTTCITKGIGSRPHLSLNFERQPSIAESVDRCENFEDFTNYLKEEHKFIPGSQILFIDESQYSLKLSRFIRFMKEEWQTSPVIITGSVVSEMFTEGHRQPVGQIKHTSMWPLSFKEFLSAAGQDSLVKAINTFSFDSFSEGLF